VSSKSVFAQAEFAFTDRFKGTGGVRYTHEDKDAVLSRNTVTPGPLVNGQSGPFPETRLSRRESNLDGSVGLQYQLFPRGIVYASWSQGSKSGGFQTTPTAIRGVPTGAEYAGETARTDEVGAKLTSPDGHFNIALFNTDVDGFQNLFNTGAVLVVQNLQVRSRGVEIDAVQRLSDTWSVNFAATYADAEDRTNRLRLTRAPKWSGVGSLSLRQPLSDSFVLRATAEVEFRSSAYLAPPGGVIPLSSSYSKLNLRVAIADERSGWELALIGKNLTDERIASFGFPLPNVAQTAVVGSEMPRTIALQFSLHR
jgi:iron complex outermembrane receptor protein